MHITPKRRRNSVTLGRKLPADIAFFSARQDSQESESAERLIEWTPVVFCAGFFLQKRKKTWINCMQRNEQTRAEERRQIRVIAHSRLPCCQNIVTWTESGVSMDQRTWFFFFLDFELIWPFQQSKLFKRCQTYILYWIKKFEADKKYFSLLCCWLWWASLQILSNSAH